jgi:hypothetical protein
VYVRVWACVCVRANGDACVCVCACVHASAFVFVFVFVCVAAGGQVHFLLSLGLYVVTLALSKKFSAVAAIAASSFVLVSLTSYGALFDRRRYALHLELARLLVPITYVGYVADRLPLPSLSLRACSTTASDPQDACASVASLGWLDEPLRTLPETQRPLVLGGVALVYGMSLLFMLGRAALLPASAFFGRNHSTESLPPAPARPAKSPSHAAGVAATLAAAVPAKLAAELPSPSPSRARARSPRARSPASPRTRTRSAKTA